MNYYHCGYEDRFNPTALPAKLDSMTDKIRAILLDTPSARSSDKILLITYMRRHGLFCYDEATKLIQFKNKDGASYDEWMRMPSTESICRIKRQIQLEAKERIKAGIGTPEDAELLPSERVAEQRVILEGVNRHYYYRG